MLEELITIGKINTFYQGDEEFIPHLREEIKEAVPFFENEFNEFLEKIKEAQEFLTSDEFFEASEGEVEDILLLFNRVGFLRSALQTEKNLILSLDNGEHIYQKLKNFVDEFYEWFYNKFDSYRLTKFNELREWLVVNPDADYYKAGLFPWLTLHIKPHSIIKKVLDTVPGLKEKIQK